MMARSENEMSPDVLALMALAHVAGHDELGPRFLALTGMDAADLRARAADPDLLAAVLGFLAAHDADLIEAAGKIGTTPERLATAARALSGPF